MTSIGSYNEDKKISNKLKVENRNHSPDSISQIKTSAAAAATATNSTSKKNPFAALDNSLPWISPKEMKNGKNFYENYSKENDKRKKEGN